MGITLSINNRSTLRSAAARLRYRRRRAQSPAVAIAYEQALRILLEEIQADGPDWPEMFFGPQGEDNPLNEGPL